MIAKTLHPPISKVPTSSFALDQKFADKGLSLNDMLAKMKPCNYFKESSDVNKVSTNAMFPQVFCSLCAQKLWRVRTFLEMTNVCAATHE